MLFINYYFKYFDYNPFFSWVKKNIFCSGQLSRIEDLELPSDSNQAEFAYTTACLVQGKGTQAKCNKPWVYGTPCGKLLATCGPALGPRAQCAACQSRPVDIYQTPGTQAPYGKFYFRPWFSPLCASPVPWTPSEKEPPVENAIYNYIYLDPCAAGSYYSCSLRVCQPCPVDTYQTQWGQTSCWPCPNR